VKSEQPAYPQKAARFTKEGEMTPTEINREFAERLFTVRKVESCFNTYYEGHECVCDRAKVIARLKDWDPYHRWDHAAMGLEKFPEYEVGKTATSRYCKVWYNSAEHPKWQTAEAFADTAPAAICLACIEAKKG
jgi:hypothetical protein